MLMKKIIIILTSFLLFTPFFVMGNVVGIDDPPEITDDINDTDLPNLDIESAWFYENPDEPEYLYTAIKLQSLNVKMSACISISWSFNGKEYVCGFDIYSWKENVFRSGDPKRATYWQWTSMPECEGQTDFDTHIITWKIPKENIGSPTQGDVLSETRAAAVPGYPLSLVYFFTGRDYRDFAPNEQDTYGLEYIIKF